MKRAAAALAFACAGCASTSPEPSFQDLAHQVERQSGQRPMWDQGGDDDAKIQRAVRDVLASELTVDGAVRVALLNNPSLHATYEELSIAQADVVQAGLLKNPSVGFHSPIEGRDSVDPPIIADVTQDFVDLLLIPARKKVAKAERERVRLRLVDEVLALAAKARAAYYTLVAAQQTLEMRRAIAEAADAAVDLATRQSQAGNLSDFDLANERANDAQIRLDLAQAELGAAAAHADLAKLLGVWGAQTGFRVPARLPELPAEELDLDGLESAAIAQRADLAAVRQQRQTLAYATNLAKSSRFVGSIEVGSEIARLNSGHVAFGPELHVELPIFDQRQAVIARLEALERAAAATERAVAIDIRNDVDAVRTRLVAARRAADHFRTSVLPLRQSLTREGQRLYDAMLLGVYQLLQIRQQEIAAMREYLDVVRDYWIARADLERAIGGRLKPAPTQHPHP